MLQVSIRCRYHTDINRFGDVVADTFEFALLKHTQKLALQLDRYLADFIEENCATIGQLKPTNSVTVCARKCTFHMTKELALEQILRNRRTIHLDQRAIGARTLRMYGTGDQLLANAGFAQNQHAGGRLGYRLDLRHHELQGRTLADHTTEIHRDVHFLPQIVSLSLEFFAQPRILGK